VSAGAAPTVFGPIEALIPHRGAMRLLDAIEAWSPAGDVVCRAAIRPGSPFLRGGRVHAVVALEYMAQAAAVWTGLVLRHEGKTHRSGFLVSVPSMTLHREHLAAGDRLTIRAAPVYRGSDSGVFACSVALAAGDGDGGSVGAPVAEATLTAVARAEAGPGAAPEGAP
jgi:predicted hotdog family 3-hydroxylacyl-ACP dehydratase